MNDSVDTSFFFLKKIQLVLNTNDSTDEISDDHSYTVLATRKNATRFSGKRNS